MASEESPEQAIYVAEASERAGGECEDCGTASGLRAWETGDSVESADDLEMLCNACFNKRTSAAIAGSSADPGEVETTEFQRADVEDFRTTMEMVRPVFGNEDD